MLCTVTRDLPEPVDPPGSGEDPPELDDPLDPPPEYDDWTGLLWRE